MQGAWCVKSILTTFALVTHYLLLVLTGFRGVASLSTKNSVYTTPTARGRVGRSLFPMIMSAVPTIIKGISCLGGEKGFGECALEAVTSLIGGGLFKALPPGSRVNLKNLAYVSCTGIRNNVCHFQ